MSQNSHASWPCWLDCLIQELLGCCVIRSIVCDMCKPGRPRMICPNLGECCQGLLRRVPSLNPASLLGEGVLFGQGRAGVVAQSAKMVYHHACR